MTEVADTDATKEVNGTDKMEPENGAKKDPEPKEANGTVKTEPEIGAKKDPEPKDVATEIIRQIEHYFGDYNLPRDKFLQEAIKEDDGWVTIEKLLMFNRLAQLSKDAGVIMAAVKKSSSGLMEIDEEKQKMRRSPSVPLPEWNDDYKKKLQEHTVYVKGFDKDDTTLDDLIVFFQKYDNVIHVNRRTYAESKDKGAERHFKGSVFVTFKDKDSATKFMESKDVNLKGTELIRKWQIDYFKEKDEEFEEKKKKRQEQKQNNKRAKDAIQAAIKDDGDKAADVSVEVEEMPLGAVMFMDGFKDPETKREDIKHKLRDDFDMEPRDTIAFIYYNKGETSAKIRFKEENMAKDLFAKIEAKGGVLEVKGSKLEVKVLEGDEEREFLDQCKKDMEERMRNRSMEPRLHKRRGGFGGGRGGKRQRRR